MSIAIAASGALSLFPPRFFSSLAFSSLVFLSLSTPLFQSLSLWEVLLSKDISLAANNKQHLLKSAIAVCRLVVFLVVFHADIDSICDGDKQKIKVILRSVRVYVCVWGVSPRGSTVASVTLPIISVRCVLITLSLPELYIAIGTPPKHIRRHSTLLHIANERG